MRPGVFRFVQSCSAAERAAGTCGFTLSCFLSGLQVRMSGAFEQPNEKEEKEVVTNQSGISLSLLMSFI